MLFPNRSSRTIVSSMLKTLLLSLLFVSAAHADVQTAQCFPNIPEAKNWPIHLVYLHGLFTGPGGSDAGFRDLEATNRGKLEKLALQMHIKIAVPLAPAAAKTQLRSWNNLSLAEIEAKAREACGGKEFAKKKAIVGFSNGAIWAAHNLNCDNTKGYAKVLVIGAQGVGGAQQGKCGGRFVESSPHVFPGIDLHSNLLDADLGENEGAPAVENPQGAQVR